MAMVRETRTTQASATPSGQVARGDRNANRTDHGHAQTTQTSARSAKQGKVQQRKLYKKARRRKPFVHDAGPLYENLRV
ncbi:hypothetical protein [Spirosoma radiotolerans]|uniref:Uncharacterized protein n=1 Tax=Spirosoma radiotolerans TaxID=1379870 RepID=A0A0E3V5N2_9BACT|nr:hypothetical protein [Spirosoma radiotolerans]AKD53776.1 hypothetical protein SD10_01525 [Spirosoma radiotolerans]